MSSSLAPLVSVITPCYNTGHLIHNLLDSLLNQDYPSIEIFIVDDGSTDDSAVVIKSYIPRFEIKGYKIIYLYQNNSGQSVAINRALKLIHGKYLVWPDSDDFYSSSTSITKMVTALENAPSNYAIVRTQEKIIDENSQVILGVNGLKSKHFEDSSLFVDCLYNCNNFYFCSGAYMVNVKALKQTTGMSIYTAKDAGQNWQLLLPLLYKYNCIK